MTAAKDTDMAIYLRGEKLIGDDYSPKQTLRWFAEEEEGYANLGAQDWSSYRYVYHALNWLHGFSALPEGTFPHVLGVGSAYGDEFRPILDRISKITILSRDSLVDQRSWFPFEVQGLDGVVDGLV